MTEQIKAALETYVALVQGLNDEYHTRNKFHDFMKVTISVSIGKKYARVIRADLSSRSVHTFIDLTNGNILKAASWATPAPNGVRGNILNENCDIQFVNEGGANYLRG